ncbi:MAG: hypothetical protein ACOYON_04985 [Fimbriimonas sp.]
MGRRIAFGLSLMLMASICGAQTSPTPVFDSKALIRTAVGGLERTDATVETLANNGPMIGESLRVTLRKGANETNATQITILNEAPVAEGDVLLAQFYIRGSSLDGKRPARVELLFEKSTSPWTKSVSQAGAGAKDAAAWRKVVVAFRSIASYAPGEVMTSIRFALQPQRVEIGGLKVLNYRKSKTLDELIAFATAENPLGPVNATLNLKVRRQTMLGFGGNFCQPRYGSTEPMDAVGTTVLSSLRVVHARIGLPLTSWTPSRGVYRDEAQARASFLALQDMKRRGIPTVVSLWEGPTWMMGGAVELQGRTLTPQGVIDCVDSITAYLVQARDKYGVSVPYFSFNEPDLGVNFKFSSDQMIDFIRVAGPKFALAGLKTKFLVGDTANGGNFAAYASPILAEKSIAPYLGPISFHCWDAMSASDESYQNIAALGKQYAKDIWCLEAGHDAQLWQAKDPWATWDNALKTAIAYERTIRLTNSSLMSYWTYQDNYPIASRDGKVKYPILRVLRQMEQVFAPGTKVSPVSTSSEDLRALATVHESGRWGVLLINPIGKGRVTLRGLRNEKARVVVSTERGQEVSRTVMVAKGEVTLDLPARSVLTVVGG